MARKITGPQIVIANRLLDGAVVFFTPSGKWSDDPADAWLAPDTDQARDVHAQALAGERANLVVEPTLIAAELRDGKPWPIRNREAIRALGPTVRLDLGYQADGRHGVTEAR